jgi:sarcosine oxidase subunit gamma
MSEPAFVSPLLGDSAAVRVVQPVNRAILRCREADLDAASERLGLALPRSACRSSTGAGGNLVALWIGPDEWLILSARFEDGWGAAVAARLDGLLCSFVDVGHRQVALAVQGPRAEDILASGCPLDLSETGFPVGMCTRTMYAKAEVVLWRTEPAVFHVEIWRSFARYVEALLREAEDEG